LLAGGLGVAAVAAVAAVTSGTGGLGGGGGGDFDLYSATDPDLTREDKKLIR
jgi:hypothetical protein